MRSILLHFLVFLIASSSYSQTGENQDSFSSRHELAVNVFNTGLVLAPDVSYEYLANENVSFGLGLLYKFNQDDPREGGLFNTEIASRVYSVTPYIRRYFSKNYARGFFIEGFGMLNSGDGAVLRRSIGDEMSDRPGETISIEEVERYTNFSLGISFGGKFLLGKRGMFLTTYFGAGHGVIGRISLAGVVTRGGISLGFRF